MPQVYERIREQFEKGDNVRDAGLSTPDDVVRYDNIRYGNDDDCQLLDVYRPKSSKGDTLPVIFSVHGGGWVYGDKERYQYYCMSLAQEGFAVVNFTYRLAPENKFPAPLEDTNLVIEWIGENAERYHLDKKHVFGVGDSAGAHILGLYAAVCTDKSYAEEYPFTVPCGFRPAAIALNCGAYQFDQAVKTDSLTENLIGEFLPDHGTADELDRICVPKHITENYVPVCFMTCTGDFLQDQASLLYERLIKCQVPCEFLFYGDKDHRLGHVFHLNVRSEEARRCNHAQCDFFRSFL